MFTTMLAVILLIVAIVLANRIFEMKPSQDRNWSPDQNKLAFAEFNGDTVKVFNIRNSTYTSTSVYQVAYYDKEYDLNKLKRVYFIVEPLSKFIGAAHTFLSFEFEGGEFIAVSVEIRREIGERFSPFLGLFKEYELIYVVADEKDVVKLRTNYRKDDVYIYPTTTNKADTQMLFGHIFNRVNQLHTAPEFYNTITNNCTTNIIREVNIINKNVIPFTFSSIFPRYSDKIAHKLGLLETVGTLKEIRLKHKVNAAAEKYADAPDFSIKIRERFADELK